MMKTKWIALILSAVLICSMYCSLTVLAEPLSGTCGETLIWTLDDNGLLTISGTGEMVNGIQPWSDYAAKITAVQIDSGVTSIGEQAFYGCRALTDITIPEGVTSIGDMAFTWCEALVNITLPYSLTSIGEQAFYVCTGLTGITIPEGVTSIGNYAFSRCTAFTSIRLPGSVTSIGNSAFYGCDNLIVYGCEGSYAQEYADACNIPFVSFGNEVYKIFTDIVLDAWYVHALQYAVDHDLFRGVSKTEFAPDTAMTRAMLVTVLWRMEGQPKASGKSPFVDVPSDEWYSEAVQWAFSNDIIDGIGDGRFAPKGNITREQVATILYRYSQKKGYDVSNLGDLGVFPDGASTSEYAVTALAWACESGLVAGAGGKLLPRDGATRAQVATILMRYQTGIAQ